MYTKGNWKVEPSEHIGAVNVSFGEFKGGIECWYHHGDTMTKEGHIVFVSEYNARMILNAFGKRKLLAHLQKTLEVKLQRSVFSCIATNGGYMTSSGINSNNLSN